MSHEQDKFTHSKRLHNDETAIKKQVAIAKKSHGLDHRTVTTEQNRLNKRHAMDCGNPGCFLCGNPRQFGHVTAQEKRMIQDMDHLRNKHSNGAGNDQDL